MTKTASTHDSVPVWRALVALADIDLGEAALTLAARLDVQSEAEQAHARCAQHMDNLREVHARWSRPGTPIVPAMHSLLAREAASGLRALRDSEHTWRQAQSEVDACRQVLHEVQRRHESLSEALKTARADRVQWRAHREALAQEDLFLARRHVMKENA